MNPRYPIYIISKGRWETRLTSRVLERLNVPYYIVIEPQEKEQYHAVINPAKILALPFSNLEQGSIPARNWVWEHAISRGVERHWILDDNIRSFRRVYRSQRLYVRDGTIFRAMEDFVERYENVALAGPHYYMFVITGPRGVIRTPFLLNSRIYSCILIKNDLPYRWRGKYNEDTDLSLRVLKDGWCTILFHAFLAEKTATMRMKGGNTETLYNLGNADGRLLMAKSLQQQHPDVVKIVRKWGRWQHQVDYRPFAANRLIRRKDAAPQEGQDEYGMQLIPGRWSLK